MKGRRLTVAAILIACFAWAGCANAADAGWTTAADRLADGAQRVLEDVTGHKTYVLNPDGSADYRSLTGAVSEVSDGDTLFLKPGLYFDEQAHAWGKTIHIIGEDRETCLIQNSTGSYSTPPLEMGSGTLANVTITADAASSTDASGYGNYAVHVEDDHLSGRTLIIRNCTLISYNNSALGIGMRSGCRVRIEDSVLEGMGENGRGLFFHDADDPAFAGETQTISLSHVSISSQNAAEPALQIDSQCTPGADVACLFEYVTVRSENGEGNLIGYANKDGNTYPGNFLGLMNFYAGVDNTNNRPEILNLGG